MTDFIAIFMDNIVELVFAVIFAVITCFVTPWVKNTLAPFIADVIIPWLKEKRVYAIVSRFVKGAEKYNKTHPINKKQWVLTQLEKKGIPITPEIEAYLESAVQELDMAIETATSAFVNTNDNPAIQNNETEETAE